MIGLTLMAMMSVFGASLKASLDKSISGTLTASSSCRTRPGRASRRRSPQKIRAVDGVGTVAEFRRAEAKIDGDDAVRRRRRPSRDRQGAQHPGHRRRLRRASTTTAIFIDANAAKDDDLPGRRRRSR